MQDDFDEPPQTQIPQQTQTSEEKTKGVLDFAAAAAAIDLALKRGITPSQISKLVKIVRKDPPIEPETWITAHHEIIDLDSDSGSDDDEPVEVVKEVSTRKEKVL